MIIGHATTLRALRAALPPVILLSGPASIGKHTIARHLADHHDIHAADRLDITDTLTAATARKVVAFASRAPFGPYRLIILNLDNASETALNILLKTLEEPSPATRFILYAANPVLPTVASRARVFRLGLLSAGELRQILTARGMTAQAADRAGTTGRGQVQTAMQTTDTAARTTVTNLIRALTTFDRDAFDRVFRQGFDPDSRDLLRTLLVEVITRRWTVFSEAEAHGLQHHPRRAQSMLTAIYHLQAAASRLGVRAALEPFLAPRT